MVISKIAISNKCLFCGKDAGFTNRNDRLNQNCSSRARKFCSLTCSLNFRHRDKIIYISCPSCKKQFRKYPDGVARKYCSMDCYNKMRINHFPKYDYPKKESKNYKVKKINGKQVYAHRWIVEQHLGRKLNRNEVVHHINGDPHDNRIENLQVMSQSDHMKLECKNWKNLSE
jgi:hypothetical protein